MSLDTIVQRQVDAGTCRRGSCPTCCQLADGSEAHCQTIRECCPECHFEYALPGTSPNRNIFIWDGSPGGGFRWNGPMQQPIASPGFQDVPIFGTIPGMSLDTQFRDIPKLPAVVPPPPTAGGAPRGQQAPAVTTDLLRGSAPAISPASQGGMRERLESLARDYYGRTGLTRAEFCLIYRVATGYDCKLAPMSDRDARDWFVEVLKAEDYVPRVIGDGAGRAPSSTPGIGGAMVPVPVFQPIMAPAPAPAAPAAAVNQTVLLVAAAAVVAVVLFRR